MIERITDLPVQGNKNSNPVDSFVALGAGDVVEAEVLTPVSLNQEASRDINENFCVSPTLITPVTNRSDKFANQRNSQTVNLKVLDCSVVQKLVKSVNSQSQNTAAETIIRDVSYLAVSHVSFVSLTPALCKKEIKHVKGVVCVNPCLFVPSAQSVPNVVEHLSVEGRLQKFWQTWEKLGVNLRVVSILKEGYALPFKLRPFLTSSPLIVSAYANP